MSITELRPVLDEIDKLIKEVEAIPVHAIVDEKYRDAYLHGVLDVKSKVLDLADGQTDTEGEG